MNETEEPAEVAFNKICHQWEDRKQYTKNEAQSIEEGFYMGWQACAEFIAEALRWPKEVDDDGARD